MKNNYDDEINMLIRRESASRQLAAFLLAAAFGCVSGAAAMKLRGFALLLARLLIYSKELEVNQYRGFVNMSEIGTIAVLAALWLIIVLAVWHRIDKTDCLRDRLKICAAWSAGAAAVCCIFHIVGLVM